jgi:hypothetical protein
MVANTVSDSQETRRGRDRAYVVTGRQVPDLCPDEAADDEKNKRDVAKR